MVCPERWTASGAGLAKIVQASYRVGLTDFRLRSPPQVTLEIRQSNQAQMIADWQLGRIDVDLPFHPAASMWLFSLHFGLAHEVGHLLWHSGPLTLREAWASYFALEVMESANMQRMLPGYIDCILLVKDRWLSMGVLMFQHHSGNKIERATASIVHVWRKVANKRVSEFLRSVEERAEAEKPTLASTFSQYFGVPKAQCSTWLWED